jgi:hypothetical protein
MAQTVIATLADSRDRTAATNQTLLHRPPPVRLIRQKWKTSLRRKKFGLLSYMCRTSYLQV